MLLKNKVVYVVTTGARRCKEIGILLNYLKNEGATCILMPTPMSYEMMDLRNIGDIVKKDFTFDREGSISARLPEEDVLVVAPCTFNTFSKIACGIADNYPLSIIHTAIGNGKPVIIAPSMNWGYFNHPATKENYTKIASWRNVSVIHPEYIYNKDGSFDRITMAPWEKIYDNICHKFSKIKYSDIKVEFDMEELINRYFPEFFKIGKYLQDNQYTNGVAGFLAKKIPEGILITSTGSSVGALNRENITLILDCKDYTIHWAGSNRPSSETPLVIELFKKYPDRSVVVHGHCQSITYSRKTLKYHSSGYLFYGKWGELYKIEPVIDKFRKGIMKLHGEIIIADTFAEALSMYAEMYNETL